MRKIIPVFLIMIFSAHLIYAGDIRSKVSDLNMSGLKTHKIDPDNHVYGILWDSSEDDFIKNWGKPNGYVRFNAEETGMIYGKQHLFLFKNHKLSGLRITRGILDWQVSKKLLPNSIFDAIQWELSNGIKQNTNLSQVKKIVGKSFKNDRYEKYYETDGARVTLNFSRLSGSGKTDETYKVHAIMVERK